MDNNTLKTDYSAAQLAEIVQGELIGDPKTVIKGVSGVNESREDTITFAENEEYLQIAEDAKVAVVLVPKTVKTSSKNIIRVENPRLAFAKIASLFAPNFYEQPGIHSSVVIDESAQIGANISFHPQVVISKKAIIGDNVILAPGVYIGSKVRIGQNTIIHPNVVIEHDSVIGENVIIHAGSVIGSDGYGFVTDKKGHIKIPQLGKVIIEDNVEIGANVTIDRGTSGPTIIKQGSKIDNLVQIAHNVEVGEENLIVAQVGIAGSTKLGKRVTLAGQTGVVGHINLGDNSTIASASVVTKDVPEGVFYSGNPAHAHRQELKELAAKRKLPKLMARLKELEEKIEKLERGKSN